MSGTWRSWISRAGAHRTSPPPQQRDGQWGPCCGRAFPLRNCLCWKPDAGPGISIFQALAQPCMPCCCTAAARRSLAPLSEPLLGAQTGPSALMTAAGGRCALLRPVCAARPATSRQGHHPGHHRSSRSSCRRGRCGLWRHACLQPSPGSACGTPGCCSCSLAAAAGAARRRWCAHCLQGRPRRLRRSSCSRSSKRLQRRWTLTRPRRATPPTASARAADVAAAAACRLHVGAVGSRRGGGIRSTGGYLGRPNTGPNWE
jgi:hypothetical protein